MRILDKYILKELMGPFVFGVCAFSSVFIGTSTLFRIAQYVTKYGAGIWSVTKLFFFSLPSIIVLTFPMSMLLASLLSFGRLSGSSEITAMKSSGVSFPRLAMPVFIVAFVVSLFTVVFNEKVVPASNHAYNQVVRIEIERNTKPPAQDHVVIKDVGGEASKLTYARRFEEASGIMYAVTLQEFQGDKLVRVENAERAIWDQGRWIMQNGIIHDLDENGMFTRYLRFEQQEMPIRKAPGEISLEQKKPEEMSIVELKQHIAALKREFVKTSLYEVELHQRVAIPMACLVFALIGTPLGLAPHRSSSSIGLGISIVVIFIYYTILTIMTALGQGGAIPAVLSAWTPNLVGILAGSYLIHRASR